MAFRGGCCWGSAKRFECCMGTVNANHSGCGVFDGTADVSHQLSQFHPAVIFLNALSLLGPVCWKILISEHHKMNILVKFDQDILICFFKDTHGLICNCYVMQTVVMIV
jgi:hypothetical protein